MEFTETIRQIIISLPFIAGTAWLLREIFKLYLNKDLEKFKSNLEKEAISHRIRYEELHGQRMTVIRDTFQKLCDMYEAMSEMFRLQHVEENKTERVNEAFNKAQEFRRYVDKNQLFFSEEQFDKTMAIYDSVDDKVWSSYHHAQIVKNEDPVEATKELTYVWKHLKEDAPKMKKSLANTFRDVIGIGD